MEGCAGADGALDMNLARVLLNDSVGDGQAKSRATPFAWPGRGFGGEEGIVDALQVFRCDAGTGVRYDRFNVAVDHGGDAQAPTAGHRLLGIEQEIEKDLLQLAGVAVNGRQVFSEIDVDNDLRGLELMVKQRESVADDLIQIGLAELRG